MVAADTVAVILLAAGSSTRFGGPDKLVELLGQRRLAEHACTMLATFPFLVKIAVVRPNGPDLRALGFEHAINGDLASGQSGSIRLGLERALPFCPQAVLIALADMPFVEAAHVTALLARADAQNPIVASTDGRRAGPPAVFGKALFPELAGLNGDCGARSLLKRATLITAAASTLRDIDTPKDLALARRGEVTKASDVRPDAEA